jgi:transmembrane sensor
MHLSNDLLGRYFQNQCTPEEERFVRKALEQDDPMATRLLEKYWVEAAAGNNLPENERSAMLANIQSRISINTTSQRSIPVRNLAGYALRVAASITILLGVGFGVYRLFSRETKLQYHTLAANAHQQQITMPDSTTIWLASHSRIVYSSAYNKDDRQVQLVGEAYFEVKHDAQRPFIVKTATLATRVLGTHFNIKADSTEQQIAITILEGKVAVSRVDSVTQTAVPLATLAPNQQLVYNRQTGKTQQHNVTAYDYAVWKDGVLNLKNITFDEGLKRIAQWYDVKISVADPYINTCVIHASFQNQPLETVLKSLGISLGFTYAIESRQVIIHGGGCKH